MVEQESRVAPRRVLVTGCAGFVGPVVAKLLLDRGYEVTGLDNFSRGTAMAIAGAVASGLRFVEGDVRSPADLAAAFASEPDIVVHLAARHFIPECEADPAGTYDINIVGTERVWQAAVAHGVQRFVFASTGDVYKPSLTPHTEHDATEPFNVYGLSKRTTEQSLLLGSAVKGAPRLILVRLFNVYGPGDRNEHLVPAVLTQVASGVRRLRLGNLWPVRDYIYVDDAAEGFVRLATGSAESVVVNVGTGGGWTVAELIRHIGDAMQVPLDAVSVPELRRAIERDSLRPDISRLFALTGWRPTRPLADGLRAFVPVVKT
jgi:UDP-glucose 4-epimerase